MDGDPAKFEMICSSNENSNDSSFLDFIHHPNHDESEDEDPDAIYEVGRDFIAYPPIRRR